jgi:hypothetical protein
MRQSIEFLVLVGNLLQLVARRNIDTPNDVRISLFWTSFCSYLSILAVQSQTKSTGSSRGKPTSPRSQEPGKREVQTSNSQAHKDLTINDRPTTEFAWQTLLPTLVCYTCSNAQRTGRAANASFLLPANRGGPVPF